MNISVPEDRAKQCLPASISTLPQGDLRDTQFIMSHGHLPAPTKAFVADVTPGKTAFWGGVLGQQPHLFLEWKQFPWRSPSQDKHEAAPENTLTDTAPSDLIR